MGARSHSRMVTLKFVGGRALAALVGLTAAGGCGSFPAEHGDDPDVASAQQRMAPNSASSGHEGRSGGGDRHCEHPGSQSLDGSCNNLRYPQWGAVGTPFLFLTGQRYQRGLDEVLDFMREEPVAPGEPNDFPYTPTEEAPDGTCGPSGFEPPCEYTIVTEAIHGLGPRRHANARTLSNALHGLDTPFAPPERRPTPTGVTHLAVRFLQLLAHDVEGIEASATPRRSRHGFPNQSDPENPTVLAGVPVLDPNDLFNIVPIYTPTGVPEPPTFRTIILSSLDPKLVASSQGPALEFENAGTPYIDADTIYGHSRATLDVLRSNQRGEFLLTELVSPAVGPIPPLAVPGLPPSLAATNLRDEAAIDGVEAFTPSFIDERNLSNIGLAALDVIWLRFHNLQAAQCQLLRPELDPTSSTGDEALFECARRRVIAVFQHVVFDELVPAFTGRPLPEYQGYRHGVYPQSTLEAILGPLSAHSAAGELSPIAHPDGTWDDRLQVELPGQPSPPPGAFPFIGALFPTPAASAAFYFALAGIPTPLGDPSDPSTPWALAEDPMSQLVRGLAYFAHDANDLTIVDALRNIPANYGLDLVANSIVRAQQLGLANYYEVRQRLVRGPERRLYGRPGCPRWLEWQDDQDDPVACFEAITEDAELAAQIREQLLNPYLGVAAKIKYLPIFTGVLMEPKLPGSIFGRVGRALMEDLLVRSRDGDRFYYRNQLSQQEQAEIESYSMADVVRAVLGPDVGVQDDVFHVPPPGFFD